VLPAANLVRIHRTLSGMELVERLERTRAQTLPYFALDASALDRAYAPGKWSVRFLLHHLADAETVLYDRIRRIVSEPRGVLWAFDEDAWARGLGYEQMPMGLSQQIYGAVREGVIYCARTHLPARGDWEFVHSEAGVRTLRQEIEEVAVHNEHHLAQIERALAKG